MAWFFGKVGRGMAALLILLSAMHGPAAAQTERYDGPVIDIHLHATGADHYGQPPLYYCTPASAMLMPYVARTWRKTYENFLRNPPCEKPMRSPESDEAFIAATLAELKKHNVYALTSGPMEHVRRWRAADPERIWPALWFVHGYSKEKPKDLKRLFQTGEIMAFGEIGNPYVGIPPSDKRMEDYWEVAERLNIPVTIHVGPGPVGSPYLGYPKYRAKDHSALTLEDMLLDYPRLRVNAMHAGWPMLDDMMAMLYAYPQLYVDTGGIAYILPKPEFYRYIRTMVEAGFGQRIMYGSDPMVWPQLIGHTIEIIQDAPFLTKAQKADILYYNAARFLALSPQTVARHHEQP